MKQEKLIYRQTSMDIEIHLDMVRVLTGNQESDISEVSEVAL